MKAFEEWYKRFLPGKRVVSPSDGWRAALEWVQRTVKELDEQDAPICMGDVIKYELEESQ